MGDYRIICAIRNRSGELEAFGYSQNGTGVMYDDLWTLEEARQAIEGGHCLYTLSPSTGERADLEVCRGGIRAKPNRSADTSLEQLPDCG